MNSFSNEKAIRTAACGRYSTQNAQHFVPVILHSQFFILNYLLTTVAVLKSWGSVKPRVSITSLL